MTKIKEQKLSDLTLDDKNFNRGTEYGGKLLRDSLGKFGAGRSILADKNGRIIAGNKTAEGCADVGIEDVVVVETDGTKLVVVKRTDVDLDTPQGREMALADNQVGAVDLDIDIDLAVDTLDLETVKAWGLDVETDEDTEEREAKEDDFDEGKDHIEVRCKPGDVWELGEHRLMCGDSIDLEQVKTLMGGVKADLCFTDPPYGYEYKSNKKRNGGENYDVIMNDDKILDFFPNVVENCDGFIFVCTTWKVLDKWIPLFKKYIEMTNMVIWNKGGSGMGDLYKTFATDYEVILTSHNGKKLEGTRCGSVWNFSKDVPSSYVHPTQKPVALSAHAIEMTSKKGAIVLDTFGGSGSTLIACEQLGRKCYMMELDPHYCDVIIARWEKLTGKEAKKVS